VSEVVPGAPLDALETAGLTERSLRRRYVLRKLATSPTFLVGAGIIAFWVFMALFSRYVTRYGHPWRP
jgi:hypothetical protein